MDPDQTARMRRLVWIHAGRKRITLVLSWHGSYGLKHTNVDLMLFVCLFNPMLGILNSKLFESFLREYGEYHEKVNF
jgi:hypothetical protein